jgi:hypothetical protein
MRTTERLKLVLAGAVLVAGACKNIDAPDQNASTLQELTGTPTRAVVVSATQGLFGGLRAQGPCTGNCAYLGREGMNLDPSNPQNVSTLYFNGGDFSQWTSTYANNRQADIVLEAIGKLSSDPVTGMTDGQKSGVRGIVYTAKALGLLYVILTTDQTGAVLDVPADPNAPVPSIASRDAVYTRILAQLDSGLTNLNAAGAAFPVTVPAGFSSNGAFNTVNGFRAFNRALRARANVYWGTPASYAEALNDLNAVFTGTGTPFVSAPTTLAQLQVGVYNTYSTTSGDATNGVYDATDRQRFAHNSLAADAVIRTGTDTTTRDARFLRKVRPVRPSSLSRYGFNVYWAFQAYNSLSDPIPVLRNEEMLLLRAEALLACTGSAPAVTCAGSAGNRALALADINTVRTVSGGLTALVAEPAPLAAGKTTGDGLLDELLYNKRYSLLWEGGYSWYDRRHYGALTTLKRDTLLAVVTKFFPYSRLPDAECNARGIAIGAGLCTIPTGL